MVAELRLAGLEVFRLGALSSNRPRVAGIYQGLGRFYSSKFLKERNRSDWERSTLYFEKAMEFGPASSILWRDLGVHLEHFDAIADELQEVPDAAPLNPAEKREIEDLRKRAEFAFRQSLDLYPEDPGALSGLGWIYFKRSDYEEAIKYYSSVTSIKNWREGERDMFLQNALWNCAACRALIWAGNAAQAEKVFQDLGESRAIATERGLLHIWRRDLWDRSGEGGQNIGGEPETFPFARLFRQYPSRAAELLA